MISRRNIRIKVMQLLYAVSDSTENVDTTKFVQQLNKNFLKTRELIIFLLHYTIQVAQYVEIDAKQRAAKNITTKEDLEINTKLAGNTLLWQILESKGFKEAVHEYKLLQNSNTDLVRKLYLQLVETDEYKYYISVTGRDRKKEIEILSFIFNQILLPAELFTDFAEDNFSNWDDDIEMVQNIINSYFSRPSSLDMEAMLGEDKSSYAKNLFTTVIEKKEHLSKLISPKFKNWDPERIASIDMILLQMGLAELLFFETIPTKVTINEYIDLAKEYSTPQSGHFINGILDNLHKELMQQGKINKIEYKKTTR